MASLGDEFLCGDDLDVILSLIDEDVLENDQTLKTITYKESSKIPIEKQVFSCDTCDKVCLSKRGLSRHKNSKHSSTSDKSADERLQPLQLKNFINQCVKKLSVDECYPESTRKEFLDVQFTSLENDIMPVYLIVTDVISEYNGSNETFFPKFYKAVRENATEPSPFKLSKKSNLILGFELANIVLAHLSGAVVKDDIVTFDSVETSKLTPKEQSIVSYLGGYVFGTLYRRIRFSSSKSMNVFHSQCLAILLAGKIKNDEANENVHQLVNVRDRGGLWKVSKEVQSIFAIAETEVRKSTQHISNSVIDSKIIVCKLSSHAQVLFYFSRILELSTEEITREVGLNLLEDMLMLFVRVRVFSFVKEIKTAHNISKSQNKLKSLRKEIKKVASSLEQGH